MRTSERTGCGTCCGASPLASTNLDRNAASWALIGGPGTDTACADCTGLLDNWGERGSVLAGLAVGAGTTLIGLRWR